MLSYGELLDLCSLGRRLRHWTLAYSCHDDGLGLRVLRETWNFIRVDEIQADPQLSTIVQEIITRREVKQQGATDGSKPKNPNVHDWRSLLDKRLTGCIVSIALFFTHSWEDSHLCAA
jgi:hypothetical protein